MRATLLGRRRELAERLRAVECDLERKRVPVSGNWNERASEQANDAVLEGIGQADIQELGAIDAALRRIELGTYGACTLCGTPIPAERLRIVPHAEYCEACALVHDTKHGAAR